MAKRPLILISNDDGVQAQGIQYLTSLMQQLGDVVVVAPDGPRSGAACGITSTQPVSLRLVRRESGLTVYECSGTPVDCVKIAFEKVLDREPDLVVSGINHGGNISVSIHYSGTVGVILDACTKQVPAIAFSHESWSPQIDFTPCSDVILGCARHVLEQGLPDEVCLNVNFPDVAELKGVKVCRLARGTWKQEWKDTGEEGVYRLSGYFICLEPEATDTDCYALSQGCAAVTPLQLDTTGHSAIESLKKLEQ